MVPQVTAWSVLHQCLESTSATNIKMTGELEIEDLDVSDGSEHDYSDHEHDSNTVKEEGHDMAESKYIPGEVDENGKGVGVTKPKLDAKDPLRPRRKKARRACLRVKEHILLVVSSSLSFQYLHIKGGCKCS